MSNVYWEKVMNFWDFKLTLSYVLKRVLAMHMDFIDAKLSLTLCDEFENNFFSRYRGGAGTGSISSVHFSNFSIFEAHFLPSPP